jgi:hypothetical protein
MKPILSLEDSHNSASMSSIATTVSPGTVIMEVGGVPAPVTAALDAAAAVFDAAAAAVAGAGAATAGAGTATAGADGATTGADGVICPEPRPVCKTPDALVPVFKLTGTEQQRIVDALLTALEADDTPISVQKVAILYNLWYRGLGSGRAVPILVEQLKTLRPDADAEMFGYLESILLAQYCAVGTFTGPILTALRPIGLENPRAACALLCGNCSDEKVYKAALEHCYAALVTRKEPVTGFLLRLVEACMSHAYRVRAVEDRFRFVAIVDKCGPSVARLPHIGLYTHTFVKIDPISALKLAMPFGNDRVDLASVADAVNAYPTDAEDATAVRLFAVKWLDAKCAHGISATNNAYGRSAFNAVSDLVMHLAGFSEEVARAVVTSGTICDFASRRVTVGMMVHIMTRLVFWWAQVQWQTDHLPPMKRVLDIKARFDPRCPELTFQPVTSPERFPLDVPAVLRMVILGTDKTSSLALVLPILRMVYGVAPARVLENPVACDFIRANPALVPADMYAAVVLEAKP